MPTGRAEFAAVTAGDGRIVVLGGGRRGPHDVAYIYDPNTTTWTTGPTMPSGRTDHVAVVAHDGRIFVISGISTDEPNEPLTRQVLILTL